MKKIASVFTLFVMISIVSACDFYQESYMTPQKVRLEQSEFVHDVNVHDFDTNQATSIANLYEGSGSGDVFLTVTYDPKNINNTSSHARKHLAEVIGNFNMAGVKNLRGNVMPVHGSVEDSRLLITFDAYQAKAPLGCTDIPGLKGSVLEHDYDYKLGCTRESLFAKQIARPKDLAGQAAPKANDGRRNSNVVETYRTGIPNEPLAGLDASGS